MMTTYKLQPYALTTVSHADHAANGVPEGTSAIDLADCTLASYEGVIYFFGRLSVTGNALLRYKCVNVHDHIQIIINNVNSHGSCPVCGSPRTKVNWRNGLMLCLQCGAKDGE